MFSTHIFFGEILQQKKSYAGLELATIWNKAK